MALKRLKESLHRLAAAGRLGHDPAYVAGRVADVYAWSRLHDGGLVADLLEEFDQKGWDMAARGSEAVQLKHIVEQYGLTPAEAEVAYAFAQGLQLADISRTRDVSINTVRTHFARIKDKLGVHTQAQALRKLIGG